MKFVLIFAAGFVTVATVWLFVALLILAGGFLEQQGWVVPAVILASAAGLTAAIAEFITDRR